MKRVYIQWDVINSKAGQGYIILQIQSKLHFCVINRVKKSFLSANFRYRFKETKCFLTRRRKQKFHRCRFEYVSLRD